ncbi:MAG: DNA gyrase inhibitor YacG [Pseudomonadota bacterium]
MTQSPKPAICPLCESNPASPDYRPFCSKRCADIDLSRWLNNSYAIPGAAAEDAEDTPGSSPQEP